MTEQRPVLFVTKEFSVEPRSGGMLRTLALVRTLSRVGRTVVVVSPAGIHRVRRAADGQVGVERLRPASAGGLLANASTLLTYRTIGGTRLGGRALVAALREALGSLGPFTLAVLDHTVVVGTRRLLPPELRCVVSMHNVESDLMRQRVSAEHGPRRLAARVETRLLQRQERAAMRDPVVVCTEADRDALLARREGAAQVVVARNGVSAPDAAPARPAVPAVAGATELLFTGALDWAPNITGILWLVTSDAWRRLVTKRPDVILVVAGRRPSQAFRRAVEAAPNTVVHADVPSMQPLLDRARLGVVPLLEGGGSRIKLLEYAANALPSVSTVVGAAGLDRLPDGVVVQTPEDPQSFCDAVLEALERPPSLTAQTVAAVLDVYEWENALGPVRELAEALSSSAAGISA
ncbi:MAG: glycosyltransferase [Dermatophilaceae bacterium]